MTPQSTIVAAATLVTLATLAVWAATGRHVYTKFEVVQRIETPIDPDDPLAQAGFYDETARVETVRRDEFHLGLLPVPQGLFDKHAVSVVSIVAPVWAISFLVLWRLRRSGITRSQ